MTDWTDAQEAEAAKEGWGIFKVNDPEHPPWELCKIDGRDEFLTDIDVWEYVMGNATQGTIWQAALDFLAERAPDELSAIQAHQHDAAAGREWGTVDIRWEDDPTGTPKED